VIDVAQAAAEPAREQRMTSLATLFIEIRNDGRRLKPEEGEILLKALWAEAVRPQFDHSAYGQLWRILEHAPPMEKLAAAAQRMLAERNMGFRGCAARYLMNAYPNLFEELDTRYNADPDPEVRDAIHRTKPTWGPQCDDCLQMVERTAESNRRGPSADLDPRPIVDPHPSLRSHGPGQPLHIHESTASLFQCVKCGSWWNFCQWYGVGYLYLDECSAGWAEAWVKPLDGLTDPPGQGSEKRTS
jgi:hypothetical protein